MKRNWPGKSNPWARQYSVLFPWMNRISAGLFALVVVGAVASNWALFVENVPTLLTNGGDEWEKLLRGLRRQGFDLDGAILDAAEFGLPQRRKRLYVVGRRDGVALRPLSDVPLARTATLRDVLEGE